MSNADYPAMMRKAAKSYYHRKRAAGICVQGGCWKPARPNRTRCAEHGPARKPKRRAAIGADDE